MRKGVRYLIAGLIAIVITVAAVYIAGLGVSEPAAEVILAAFQPLADYDRLTIEYPLDGVLFPPDICAPTFRWKDDNGDCDTWLVSIEFEGGAERINCLVRQSDWTPKPMVWEAIKKRSVQKQANVTIIGVNRRSPRKILSANRINLKTSSDHVGAPVFYREVNLPFVDAVKDPSLIRWRFGAVSSASQPPVVLEGMPVCGNCHSFSRNADTLAMDVDYANSKGSYVITRVAEQMTFMTSDVITWNEYKKEDGEQTFGLLSQISPDGRFIVSTVKDKSVFVPQPDLAFSQLFFPIKGILCIYDRQQGAFRKLPGADDPQYVQSNPTWSPDGKDIVFARTIAYDLKHTEGQGKVLLTREECKEFTEDGKPFKFDLYRIPFNNGQGGKPEPIEGASNNGMSNFFARYSPDGKWIVFCKANNYMLLQPDSELYIIPAEGGEARRLRANTSRMNSWHSFSPNGKWLVFASKAYSPYTQLFLTHIDEQGHSTPAVLLSSFTAPDRAANIPEFVNAGASAIKSIRGEFLDDYSYVRAGNAFFKAGDTDNAIEEYKNALILNPRNTVAHRQLGFLFYNPKGMHQQGMEHYRKAMEYDPNDPRIHHDFGMALLHQRKFDRAAVHLAIALQGMPEGLDKQYNLMNMQRSLGQAMLYKGDLEKAELHLSKAIQLDPNSAATHYLLATTLAKRWKLDQALEHHRKAVSLNPRIDTSAQLHDLLAMNYAKARRFREAVVSAQKALNLALIAADEILAQEIRERLEIYKQRSKALLK
ncbi:MAG: tetratricopeptide repeat protein [Phycisphaerae bacterium]|nr:tetratricopeptide repeat protein [Phycisphaerae bacterium]